MIYERVEVLLYKHMVDYFFDSVQFYTVGSNFRNAMWKLLKNNNENPNLQNDLESIKRIFVHVLSYHNYS